MNRRIKFISVGTLLFLLILGLGLANTVTAAKADYKFRGKVYFNGKLLISKKVKVEIRAKFSCMAGTPPADTNKDNKKFYTFVLFDYKTNKDGKYYYGLKYGDERVDELQWFVKATYKGYKTGFVCGGDIHKGNNWEHVYIKQTIRPDPNPSGPNRPYY